MINYFLMPHPPIIIPQIGKGEEEKIINTSNALEKAFKEIREFAPDTILIISPHGTLFRDGFSIFSEPFIWGDFSKFDAPSISINYEVDLDLSYKIIDSCKEEGIPILPLNTNTSSKYGIPLSLDHGASVPLYFHNESKNTKLIYITYSLLSKIDHVKFGAIIKKVLLESNKKISVIASGDLSHCLTENAPYPYSPAGKEFDNILLRTLKDGDMLKVLNIDKALLDSALECGMRSIYLLSGIIGSEKVTSNLYSYEGPFGVGYAVMSFSEGSGNLLETLTKKISSKHIDKLANPSNPYTYLARKSLEHYLKVGSPIDLSLFDTSSIPNEKKGVFVSIYLDNSLRGCVGTTTLTTNSLAQEIVQNSLSAAFKDPRFPPLSYSELLDSTISISLLDESESATFIDLDPSTYGIIVKANGKTGLLLPNLEGVNSAIEQLAIAKAKGNIADDELCSIEKFTVLKFEE